ncbi:MAG: hypothetical protein H7Z75_22285 [Ferruginibacter sp.]|nr:hypothetical protein [Cytophagales bacterium]
MKTNEEDLVRLSDIAGSILEVQGYVGRSEYNDFATREDIKEAVVSQMQQIGGAAALLSDEFKEKYRDIDWDVLKGLQYSHYDQELEMDLMPHWYIITNDFPDILARVSNIVTELQHADELENELMLDNPRPTPEAVEARVESETALNQRFTEDDLVGDLESEADGGPAARNPRFTRDLLEEVGLESLDEKERKILEDVSRELTKDNQLEMESLDNLDLSTFDRADDSFIDQRFEDVDLMEGSSLDDEPPGDDPRERGDGMSN